MPVKLTYLLLVLAGPYLVAVGCGYTLLNAGRSLGCSTFHVGPILDAGKESGLATVVHRHLTERLVREGVQLVFTPAKAQCVVYGRVYGLSTTLGGTSYGDRSVSTYRQRAQVELWVQARNPKRTLRTGRITVGEVFLPGAFMSSSALEILATESGRRRVMEAIGAKIAEEALRRLDAKYLTNKPGG
jgi:hypothetical protein